MTAQTRTTLKTYFNTGDVPTETNFADFIDSIPSDAQQAALNAASSPGAGNAFATRNDLPSASQQSALNAANSPGAGNAFATVNDLPSAAEQAALDAAHSPGAGNPFTTRSDLPLVNVKDYGAAGDGATDDTTAIQNALNAAAGGGVVWFPVGVYLISAVLEYYAANTLRGVKGASVIRNKATRGASDYIMLIPDSGSTVTNVLIEGLTFDQRSDLFGFSATDQCVSINEVAGITIRDCVFLNVVTMAVWADTKTADTTTSQVRIENCWVQNSEGGGISLFGDVQDVVITRNRIESCKDDAVAVQDLATGERPTNVVISHNTLLNNNRRNTSSSTPHAVLVYGAENVTVTDNVVDGTVASAISVQNGTSRSNHAIVAQNIIRNAGVTVDSTAGVPGHGIMVFNADNVQVLDNIVVGSRQYGIGVQGIDWLTLAHNRLESNTGGTISSASCTNATQVFNGENPNVLGGGLRLNNEGAGALQMKNFSLANNSASRLTIDTGYTKSMGFALVSCLEEGSAAIYMLTAGNVVTFEVSDPMNQYSAASGTASSTNIYCQSASPWEYYIENKRGSARTYYALLWLNAS